jgi:hypothetical protein
MNGITIIPVTDHESYTVNGHLVYKNQLDNWTCNVDLSAKELHAFDLYENVVINNKRLKHHTKATYKG